MTEMKILRTNDIREEFKRLLAERKFTSVNREASMTGLMGNSTIEIVGTSFIADEVAIFGEVNWDYVRREEEWYNSCSLNVNDIPGGAPAIWKAVADPQGFINSNYGWCIYSPENGLESPGEIVSTVEPGKSQYNLAIRELWSNPESRRAVMIYTRPSMWLEYNLNGRSDFMCTNAVHYLIRDGAVHAVVQMRSNDAVFGYKNDRAWAHHVLEKVTADLNEWSEQRVRSGLDRLYPIYSVGNIYWQVSSLHVYARHFHLVDPNFKKET